MPSELQNKNCVSQVLQEGRVNESSIGSKWGAKDYGEVTAGVYEGLVAYVCWRVIGLSVVVTRLRVKVGEGCREAPGEGSRIESIM